jgi:acetate kinase
MAAILTLNAGSSSIKFGVYEGADEPVLLGGGQVDGLGPEAKLILKAHGETRVTELGPADHAKGVEAILGAIAPLLEGRRVAGVGHRVVHGGIRYDAPVVLTSEVRQALRDYIVLAPLHQPHNLAAVEAAVAAFPEAVQVGCFDTAFHRGHPFVNDTFGLPRALFDEGVRRYGFHGLSYEYITSRLAAGWPELHAGRVVVAHLGNGASMCAIRGGKSVGSTMGFSALDGLPMGTRCGQVDPGVLLYLLDKGMSAAELTAMLYKESGLKGLSGISHDMRVLLESDAPEAGQAIDYYVFRIRRELGAMAAVLGGLDGVVFCGGIGENAAPIRARVLEGMEWLGLTLDAAANETRGAAVISTGPVPVLVIPTDEEQVIARATRAELAARGAA